MSDTKQALVDKTLRGVFP